MRGIEFDPGTYTITLGGQSAALLPKEYALLAYLYANSGRAFTREQLLDAVWPMEAPTDRTVDDHVYRLRKKLARFTAWLAIETVRGAGYRLSVKRPRPKDSLPGLAGLSEEMRSIADKYLKYGRGDALLTLSRHQETLGFEMDPYFRQLLRLMEGDARYLVDEREYPFAERAFLLLLLYHYANPPDGRKYVELAIERKILPQQWQWEIEHILVIPFAMDWGDFGQAKAKLELFANEVQRNRWDGLIPIAANFQLEYDLNVSSEQVWRESLKRAEETIARYPYQREEGQLLILKGIASYASKPSEGLRLVREGLDLLRESQFILNLMNGLHTVIHFAERNGWGRDGESFIGQWQHLCRQIGLDEIQEQVRLQLDKHLRAL